MCRARLVQLLLLPWLAESTARVESMEAIEVRPSPRARRWRLEAPWGEPARLTVPIGMSRIEVERLLVQELPWLEEQRRRQVAQLGLERLAVSESEARIGARELISALAEEEAKRIGVAYRRIQIGDQRSRWPRALPSSRPQPLQELLEPARAVASLLARSARLVARIRA